MHQVLQFVKKSWTTFKSEHIRQGSQHVLIPALSPQPGQKLVMRLLTQSESRQTSKHVASTDCLSETLLDDWIAVDCQV